MRRFSCASASFSVKRGDRVVRWSDSVRAGLSTEWAHSNGSVNISKNDCLLGASWEPSSVTPLTSRPPKRSSQSKAWTVGCSPLDNFLWLSTAHVWICALLDLPLLPASALANVYSGPSTKDSDEEGRHEASWSFTGCQGMQSNREVPGSGNAHGDTQVPRSLQMRCDLVWE